MPGKRTPADPGELNASVHDTNPQQAGIQNGAAGKIGGGQYKPGQTTAENAFRETRSKDEF